MKLILNRKSTNPSCTLGELTSSDGILRLVTKEARLPADRESYIMFLLPPKTYQIRIETGAINYKDKTIRAYWPMMKKVPWFPKAGFFTGNYYSPRMGRIEIGTEIIDDYTITGGDVACQQMIRWAKSIYDTIGEDFFPLTILQDETTLITSTLSQDDYNRQLLLAKEKEEQEALTNEIFNTP